MNKYLTIAAVTAGFALSASSANAQSVACPYGYTCVPISRPSIPVICPYGYTCTPVNPSYPSYPQYPTPTYPTYPTYPTNPSNPAGPLRVVSPNGGETWQKGTVQSIRWTAPYYFVPTYADIRLLRSGPSCTYGYACAAIAYAPYTIATNLSINQSSYSWTVGDAAQGFNGQRIIVPDGQYTVQICQSGGSNCVSSAAPFTIYGGTGGPGYPSPQAPTISGIDAPTSLSVGQVGTWTIRAADPQNGILSYSVDWGDQAMPPYAISSASSAQFTQTSSFTHSYSTTGTYTVTFTVRNAAGLTAQSKTTVYVGTNNSQQPITVLSPNGGEIWRRGTQQSVTWSTQNTSYPYYSGYNNTGYVRITLEHQCPSGMYCTAIYRPPYVIQSSAPNSGSSVWFVGSATLDGSTAVSVPSGTYVMKVCRQDSTSQYAACDTSNSPFTLTD